MSAKPNTFILVHGAWHGAWCWEEVSGYLSANGHTVKTPTLAGLGERSDEDPTRITLATHVQDIIGTIDSIDTADIVLVGHSYAGFPMSVAASERAEKIGQLIYLDAFLPSPGQSFIDVIGVQDINTIAEDGYVAPMLSPTELGLIDPVQIRYVASQLTDQPAQTLSEAAEFDAVTLERLDRHFIHTSTAFDSERQRAGELGFSIHEIHGAGHDSMITTPRKLASLLARLGSTPTH